jgi:hypothetical protein
MVAECLVRTWNSVVEDDTPPSAPAAETVIVKHKCSSSIKAVVIPLVSSDAVSIAQRTLSCANYRKTRFKCSSYIANSMCSCSLHMLWKCSHSIRANSTVATCIRQLCVAAEQHQMLHLTKCMVLTDCSLLALHH